VAAAADNQRNDAEGGEDGVTAARAAHRHCTHSATDGQARIPDVGVRQQTRRRGGIIFFFSKCAGAGVADMVCLRRI